MFSKGMEQVVPRVSRAAIAILLVLIFFVSPANSTVSLVLVTPDAIVIGSDSKTVQSSMGSPLVIGEDEKVVAIAQGHVIIGTVGLARITHHDGQIVYDFPTWARALNIQAENPISQVAQTVASESFRIMNDDVTRKLARGTFSMPSDASLNPLITYFIGKCDVTKCSAVTIRITIDWKKRILNQPEISFSDSNSSRLTALFSSVDGGVLSRFFRQNSPSQQPYLRAYPKEIGPLFQNRPLTPEELVNLAKLLLKLEINEHSDLYSFPVVIYSMSAHGTATRHEYKQ